jgi:lipid A 3-O-deacylase
MNNNFYNRIFLILILISITFTAKAEENKNISEHEYNFYTGNFDFSDNKQKAIFFGFQHQNENLKRNTFLGNASPITGGFITQNSAAYIYTGVEWNYSMGEKFKFTPSFAPGLYFEGDGKDLGHVLEFKTEIQASYSFSENTSLGMSYNHISNASLGNKNPGANSYMINLLKNF